MGADKPVRGEERERRKPDLFQRVVSLEEEYQHDQAKALKPLAQAYIQAGRPKSAITLIEKHLKKGASEKELQVVLAEAYFDTFDNARARDILGALGGYVDDSSRAQRLLGELALEDNKSDEAKEHLLKAIKVNGVNRQAIYLLQGLGVDVDAPPEEEEEEATAGLMATHWDREPLSRAVLHVLISLVVFGALFQLYKWRADIAFEAANLVMEARESMESPDVTAIRHGIATYEKVLALDGSNDHAIAGLAEANALLWYEYGLESGKAQAEKYIAEAKDDDIERAERYLAEGLALIKQGRTKEAKALALDLLKKGAQDERIYFFLGAAQRQLGELAPGREELRKAADLNAKRPLYAIAIGDAYYVDGDDRNPSFFWTRAERSNLSHVIAQARSVIAKVWKGEPADQLERKIAKLKDIDEDRKGPIGKAAILWAQAELQLRESQHKEAEQSIDQALELLEDDPTLLDVKGRILLDAGEASRGLAYLKKANSAVPSSKRFTYDLVSALSGSKEFDRALELMAGLEEEYGEEAEYHIKVGDIYRDQGNYEKALASYNKAIHANEGFAPAYYALGYLFQVQKKFQDAANSYQKAAELRERYPEVYTQMGVIYANLGDIDGSNGWFDDAEKMFLISRTIPPHRIKAFYKTAVDTFVQLGSKGAKFKAVWEKKASEYKRI